MLHLNLYSIQRCLISLLCLIRTGFQRQNWAKRAKMLFWQATRHAPRLQNVHTKKKYSFHHPIPKHLALLPSENPKSFISLVFNSWVFLGRSRHKLDVNKAHAKGKGAKTWWVVFTMLITNKANRYQEATL